MGNSHFGPALDTSLSNTMLRAEGLFPALFLGFLATSLFLDLWLCSPWCTLSFEWVVVGRSSTTCSPGSPVTTLSL